MIWLLLTLAGLFLAAGTEKRGVRVLALVPVVFLGPVLYYSDNHLVRTWHRTSDALEIPLMWVTLAVPTAVVIIFFISWRG